ncbi:MAG: thiamine-phosphate kinase [Methylophilaceae bacterium]
MSVEFSVINKYFNLKQTKAFKGIGDDAALIKKNKDYLWAISCDMLNEETHFLPNTNPYNLGWKSLAVNISDIHAMGGTPKFALLAIALPYIKEPWIKEFSNGLFSCAKKYEVELIGGDTTKGPLAISICILGEVHKKNVLLRSKAKQKDDIWVTGELGLAALGLAKLQGKLEIPEGLTKKAIQALEKPQLHPSIIQKLSKLSNAAIDISDGLIADLNHILKASQVGAEIFLDHLPINSWIKKNQYYDISLHGGDDYQLLFTSPQKNRDKILKMNKPKSTKLTKIGTITKNKSLNIIDQTGRPYITKKKGFEHFESK